MTVRMTCTSTSTPNTPTPIGINLWATSNVFRAGHRVRLEVSSSNFPRFDRNPNTGRPTGLDTAVVFATMFWVVAIIAATAWSEAFGQGPAERVYRLFGR